MPRPFAITAASNSVFLDDERRGEARFTVSNQSGRSIEGRARVVVEEAKAESWVTLRGAVQRAFATAGTEQYTVEIEVPPDAPSGYYTVRLDMVGEERPDEQYVEGPTVTFEVPERDPEPEPFPWKIVAAIAAVLLIGGGVLAWALWPEGTVAVPELAEHTVEEADSMLQAEDLRLEDVTEESSETVQAGLIIRSDPEANAQVERNTSVDVFLSSGSEVGDVREDITFEQFPDGSSITESAHLEGDEFRDWGILLDGAPPGEYCSDARAAIRRGGYQGVEGAPSANYLTTASPSSISRCNSVPVSIEFVSPVRIVTLYFAGAQRDYTLTAFDREGNSLGQVSKEGRLRELQPITFAETEAQIARVEFGRQAALTRVFRVSAQ